MRRAIHKLAIMQVKKAVREGTTVADGGGLYLQRGSSWIFKDTMRGRSHHVGLGPYNAVDLPTARERARKCRELLAEGQDPLGRRRADRVAAAAAEATTMTFDDCCAHYYEAHKKGWSPKYGRQWLAN